MFFQVLPFVLAFYHSSKKQLNRPFSKTKTKPFPARKRKTNISGQHSRLSPRAGMLYTQLLGDTWILHSQPAWMIMFLDLLEGENVIFCLCEQNLCTWEGWPEGQLSGETGRDVLSDSLWLPKRFEGSCYTQLGNLTVINHCPIFPGFDYNASRSYL